jgi:hypothetical protein
MAPLWPKLKARLMRCVGPVMTEGKSTLEAAQWPRYGLS